MSREEFTNKLILMLKGTPESEIGKVINYYDEMLDEKIEDGFTEEEAVNSLEDLDSIVKRVIDEIPLQTLMKEKVKKTAEHENKMLNILLLPYWLLFMPALSILCYLVIWLFMLVLVTALASSAIVAAGGIIYFFILLPNNLYAAGISLASAIICFLLTPLIYRLLFKIYPAAKKLSYKVLVGIKTVFIK